MAISDKPQSMGLSRRFVSFVAVALALAVFGLTWVGISESRTDSFRLLVVQGKAFTEALAQASRNAITSEGFYDRLVTSRYSDLVSTLAEVDLDKMTDADLMKFAQMHDIYGVYVYRLDSTLAHEAMARGPRTRPPAFVENEVKQLIANPESNYVLLLDEGGPAGEMTHYYLELTNRLDRVVVIAVDALYYGEALKETGIGYLAQKMAQEQGVVYIIYQSTDGIIFASRKPGNLLAIESDPFLKKALDSDSIVSRVNDFQGERVLELVRPFSTEQYPFGLFRVGLSLKEYYSISRGFDRQMLALAVVLFVLLLVVLLYLNSREKRKEISLRYTRMKSVTDRIFEQMHTGVAVVDGAGVITMANRAFEAIFDMHGVTGKRFTELVPVEILSLEEYALRGAKPDEIEISLPGRDGTKRLLIVGSKVEEESAGPPSLVLVAYDITRFREYELAATRKERLSEMGNLAAGVAHEIRNPLNTISIAAQRLASEFSPTDRSDEYLGFTQKIRSETRRLNDIITRFLALAREDRRGQAHVMLHGVITEVADFLRVEAEKLNIELSIGDMPDVGVAVDKNKLRQVFLNLFNNSKEAFAGRPGKISIRGTAEGSVCTVHFIDNGPGISPDIRDKVFSPYFTTKESGTGLGLPTVHRIITDAGGDVTVGESEWGGADFKITLPLYSAE